MTRALLIAMLLCSSCGRRSNDVAATTPFRVTTFRSAAGWGYVVMIREKPVIKQPYIPAVPGKTPFRTEGDAIKVGSYVCSLVLHRQLPAVRLADLVRMEILPDTCAAAIPSSFIH